MAPAPRPPVVPSIRLPRARRYVDSSVVDVCIGALHGFSMAGSTLTVVRTQDQQLLEQAMRERQIKMPSKPWQHLPPQLHHAAAAGANGACGGAGGPAHHGQQPPMMPNGAPMPPLPPAPSNGPLPPAMQWSDFMGASPAIPAPWGPRPPPGPAPPPGGPGVPRPPQPPPGARPYAPY